MPVSIEHRGPALWVTVDRPGALNAIDLEVMGELERALELARASPGVRALVLTGAGERAFVSGGDLRAFAPLRSEQDARAMAGRMKAILSGLERLDCWTIACVNGDAYGGGCETLLAFDQRVLAGRARLGFTQARFRLPPGWGGLTRLVELVGRPKALRLLATEALITADEALALGLADEVVPAGELTDHTQALAESMARQDREMIAALKRGALRARALPRDQAIEAELDTFARMWADDAHHERVDAFLQKKRKP
jgi:enoyl-CoA hydratase/carnithine racemase